MVAKNDCWNGLYSHLFDGSFVTVDAIMVTYPTMASMSYWQAVGFIFAACSMDALSLAVALERLTNLTDIISFRKVAEPYGWLGNMSPHPISYAGETWKTAEHFFQCWRFNDPAIQEAIKASPSPMGAKMIAKKHADQMFIEPRSIGDRSLMKLTLDLKLRSNLDLLKPLHDTGTATLIEDVSNRPNESGLFWGAALVDGKWTGQNVLGLLWMDLRFESRKLSW